MSSCGPGAFGTDVNVKSAFDDMRRNGAGSTVLVGGGLGGSTNKWTKKRGTNWRVGSQVKCAFFQGTNWKCFSFLTCLVIFS